MTLDKETKPNGYTISNIALLFIFAHRLKLTVP